MAAKFASLSRYFLTRPALFISLGLHLLLLFVPLPDGKKNQNPLSKEQSIRVGVMNLPRQSTRRLKTTQAKAASRQVKREPKEIAKQVVEKPIPSPAPKLDRSANTNRPSSPSVVSPLASPSPKPTSDAASQQTISGSPPGEYYELLSEVLPPVDRYDPTANDAKQELFQNPELFYDSKGKSDSPPKMLPGIDKAPRVTFGYSPTDFYTKNLKPTLEKTFEKVSEVGEYGGGVLYELRKDRLIVYLNLLETKDHDGVIIVTWLRDPRKVKNTSSP